MLDRYLAAVVAHDPAKAPLVVGFRQTEYANSIPRGKGVWSSVTAPGRVQRRYFDPVTGQVGNFGMVMEGGETAIVTVRLRVENRALTEAESYIARENDPGLNGPRQPGRPPARQRVDRATLGRIVDSYFDAITSHDGSIALTHRGFGRAENGSPAPGAPTPRNVASWWFVIDDAKIRTTHTAMFYPPPQLAVPNWPPFEGNWPLPQMAVAAR
jgi:hypothetical protein